MQPLLLISGDRPHYGKALVRRYSLWLAWYLLGVWALWSLGIEAIYRHPTPFYGFYFPSVRQVSNISALLAIGWLTYLVPTLFWYPRSRKPSAAIARLLVFTLLCGVSVYFFVLEAGRLGLSSIEYGSALWSAMKWQLLPWAVCSVFLAAWWQSVRKFGWLRAEYTPRQTAGFLAGCVVFSVLFSAALASLDGGTAGIFSAYSRHGYEYVSDIGVGGSIRGLFKDYVALHPYLSMHSKVHPPGPIALFWMFSLFVGRSPEALSIATIVVGSLSVFPLYIWVRDLSGERTARTFALLFPIVPTITLFTATSADILFMPFTAFALVCFGRAIHGTGIRAWLWGIAGGVVYAMMSLLSFNLLVVGAFFGFVGLWRMFDPSYRVPVVRTAITMLAAFLAFHTAVWAWSGFDVFACFSASLGQFSLDQEHLEEIDPRWPSWAWRVANPVCWIYFWGIPISMLFLWRLRWPNNESRALMICCALTVGVLSLLYLARGEGERSAMYIVPFAVFPAAHLLQELGTRTRSYRPLLATIAFLAFQCWLTEAFLFTYW